MAQLSVCECVCFTKSTKVYGVLGVPRKISVDKENKTQLLCQAKETKSIQQQQKRIRNENHWETVEYTKSDTHTHGKIIICRQKYLRSYSPVYLHANGIIFIHVYLWVEERKKEGRWIDIQRQSEWHRKGELDSRLRYFFCEHLLEFTHAWISESEIVVLKCMRICAILTYNQIDFITKTLPSPAKR